MKTNLIKTELTHAQILNHQLNWGYQPSMIDTLTDTFKECFPYDSQACFNPSPQIKYLNGLFTIIVPFTC